MTDTVVVDASLAVKWVLDEPDTPEARRLAVEWAARGVRTIAPVLLAFELVNVIYKRLGREQLTLDDARDILANLLASGPSLEHDESLPVRALELAHQLGRPATYDAHYLALAEREGCECWTADERLWNAVKATLPWVRWIGEHRP